MKMLKEKFTYLIKNVLSVNDAMGALNIYKRRQVENIKIYYRGTEVSLCEVSYEPDSNTVKINFQ